MALDTTDKRLAHLLRRAGLGASPSELQQYAPLGIEGTLDALLNYEQSDEGFALDIWELQNDNGQLNAPGIGGWWTTRMIMTKRPLQERLTLFWHDHFACSAEKAFRGPTIHKHNELLRRNATGSFETMLLEVARDPAMLLFLDGQSNVKSHPNENFARELMELYTMGIGNYTERDVQEAARAFTGWGLRRPGRLERIFDPHAAPEYMRRSGQHDNGDKSVLGHSGNLSGDDVLRLTLEHPATSRNICRKLWEWFVYYNPDDAVVDRLAGVFTQSNYEIKPLLRAIFTSDEFYSDKAERALYKSPVDFVVPVLRAFNVAPLLRQVIEMRNRRFRRTIVRGIGGVFGLMHNMGQTLLFPPSVAGWEGGPAWVNTATMIERIKFAGLFAPEANHIPQNNIFGDSEPQTAGEVTSYLLSALDSALPPDKQQMIIASAGAALADKPELDEKERQQVVFEACQLIFACPEYQFY